MTIGSTFRALVAASVVVAGTTACSGVQGGRRSGGSVHATAGGGWRGGGGGSTTNDTGRPGQEYFRITAAALLGPTQGSLSGFAANDGLAVDLFLEGDLGSHPRGVGVRVGYAVTTAEKAALDASSTVPDLEPGLYSTSYSGLHVAALAYYTPSRTVALSAGLGLLYGGLTLRNAAKNEVGSADTVAVRPMVGAQIFIPIGDLGYVFTAEVSYLQTLGVTLAGADRNLGALGLLVGGLISI